MEDVTNAPATVSTPTTRIVEGVIAETSEPVEIEEDDDDDDEDLGLCMSLKQGRRLTTESRGGRLQQRRALSKNQKKSRWKMKPKLPKT